MARKDIIIMSKEELKKLHVIRQVLAEKLKWREASKNLELSIRQIARLVSRVKILGDEGIVHKLRGKKSNRRIKDKEREEIIKIYKKKYYDFGPTLAREKLAELDGIKISNETLRQMLKRDKEIECVWQRKGREHRKWRERKESCGAMVQMDGSKHDWFEGRGDECVLMGYIDDATNRVYARFYGYEGTFPAMDSFRRYIRKYGIPISLYLDKHTTYHSTQKLTPEEELEGKEKSQTQFERAVKELGGELISAHSPQAKGRIERLFKTFQDRVIKEMRLAGISNIEEANKFLRSYLPKYNRRFSVVARSSADLHRAVPNGLNLDRIFCIKTRHPVRNDFTVIHEKKLYQIDEKTKANHVVVEERICGSLRIYANDKHLKFHQIEKLPKKKIDVEVKAEISELLDKPKKKYIPPKDHPWRRYGEKLGSGSYARY